MDIQVYSPDEMPESIQYQILSFMRTEWPQGFMGKLRGRRWISRPEFNPLHFVMMDDDFVIGHAESLWRTWEHQQTSYRVYGISGVFVYPDYRGAGYGKQLIDAVTEDCRNRPDADLGMLWCEPDLRDFYSKCGWEQMASTTTLLGDTPAVAIEHHDENLFMTFFSDKAQQHRSDFLDTSVYFGWTTW